MIQIFLNCYFAPKLILKMYLMTETKYYQLNLFIALKLFIIIIIIIINLAH